MTKPSMQPRWALQWWVASTCVVLQAGAQAPGPESCRASDLGVRPIVLPDGDRVFVEPEAVVFSKTQILIAGSPSYYWQRGGSAFALRSDSVIAVIADTSGKSIAVRSPLGPGRTHSVRAVSLPGGQWVVSFAEAAPLARPSDDPLVSSLWVGVLDARGRWSRMEQLPTTVGRVIADRASLAARSAEAIALAIPVQRNDSDHVVVFVRTGGRWREDHVLTREANYTALTFDRARTLDLGVVHLDPSGAPDHNSLWLYTRSEGDTSWSPATRLVRGLGQAVHHPRFALSSRPTAVWLAEMQGIYEARAIRLGHDEAPPFAFGQGALQVFPETEFGTTSVWETYHQPTRAHPQSGLFVWAAHGDQQPRRVAAFDVAFDGVIGVAAGDGLILAAGPVRAASASDPAVSLALHRLALRCD